MALVNQLMQKLNAGELSPRLTGFVGLDKYPSGCRIMENMIALAQGPATKRPGTRFVAETKNSSQASDLIPFEFSDVQAYGLEIGDRYMRPFRNRGVVRETGLAIGSATQANPVVVGIAGHAFVNGDDIEIDSVAGMTELNGRRFRVAGAVAGVSVQLHDLAGNTIDGTAYGAYSAGGTAARVYTLTMPYLQADLFDSDGRLRIKYAQSADVMYLVHPSYAPRKLSRLADASWTIAAVDFTDGPYLDENVTSTTLTPGAASGSGVTITASSVTGINDGLGFQTTDVGRLVRIGHPATSWAASTAYLVGDIRYNAGNVYRCVTAGTSAAATGPTGVGLGIVDGTAQWDWVNTGGLRWGWAKIVGWTSTTVVTADILGAFGATSARASWRLGAWSATTGYPAAVGFHEERLFFGGAAFNPQRFDASKTNDFENFTPGTKDDDPLSFSMASNKVNAIRSFASAKDLIIFTLGGEGKVGTEAMNQPLTPTNVTVRWQTHHGSAIVLPVTVANALLFVQRQGRKLRELAYSIEDDGYRSPDVTQLADHITKGGLIDMAYQQEPWSVVWATRPDGTLLGFTYLRAETVLAWHRHILGGSFAGGQAVAEAVAAVPGSGSDELWMIVKRTINGRTVRTVEFLEDPLPDDGDQADAFYVDCGLTYDGAATTIVGNLWHLIGETVKVLADGGVHPDCVVQPDGTITLDYPAFKVQVGLGYKWRIQPMPFEGGAQAGTAQGQIKRIGRLHLRLLNTLGVRVGRSEINGQWDEIAFRDAGMATGTAPPMFSGDKKVTNNDSYASDPRLLIFHDDPTPATIVALIFRAEVNEGA